MTFKSTIILCAVSIVLTAGLTRYYFPMVKTQTITVTQDVVHTQVQTVTKTVKLPSGEVDTTTTSNQNTNQVLTQDKNQTLPQQQKNWLLSLSYGTDIHTLTPAYGVAANRRILGPLYLGGTINTQGQIGVTLGMEF